VRGARVPLPRWVNIGLIPLANIALALLVAGLIVLTIGESPLSGVRVMLAGALGDSEGIGYTLYYATNFIFTGLAVAVAFHAGLFNIGGEGQATIGGLGVGLVLLAGDGHLPFAALLPLALVAGTSSARPGHWRRPGCRPIAAVTSSSPRSCSISWPRC
jgi:general nucleoside transport system permease protein